MSHAIHRVVGFSIIGDYQLEIRFEDGLSQTVDFRPILAGRLFKPLRDLSLFNAVRIDLEVHTLVWPNGADFDPATLHDWPLLAPAWIERAKSWEANQRLGQEC